MTPRKPTATVPDKDVTALLAAIHRQFAAQNSIPSMNVTNSLRHVEEHLKVAHCPRCGEMHRCEKAKP